MVVRRQTMTGMAASQEALKMGVLSWLQVTWRFVSMRSGAISEVVRLQVD
jgi:hypothetical protein